MTFDRPDLILRAYLEANKERYDEVTLKEFLRGATGEFIRLALLRYPRGVTHAARRLGVRRENLHRKIRSLGFKRG
jgi:DNA-binding NtrC family response regulator